MVTRTRQRFVRRVGLQSRSSAIFSRRKAHLRESFRSRSKVNLRATTCFQRVLRPFRHLGRLVSKKWGIKMRYIVSIAALAATLVAATPAMAASSATATANARGIVLKSLSLTSSSDLDFGTVAADATNPGTVSVDADTGARSTTG